MVTSSPGPLVLLDGAFDVVALSASFCEAFDVDCETATGQPFTSLGAGEWDLPQLRSLLQATLSGAASIEAYEIESGRLFWEIDQQFDSVPVLVDEQIIAYRFDDGLLIYDAYNGSLVGQVSLSRTVENNSEWRTNPVWLAGHDTTIALLFQGSGELLTLQLAP